MNVSTNYVRLREDSYLMGIFRNYFVGNLGCQ